MADIVPQQSLFNTFEERGPFFSQLLEDLPFAGYTCDANGYVTYYNEAALNLWGIKPEIEKRKWCGFANLYLKDGTSVPIDQCPMAIAIREGRIVDVGEIVAESIDGKRFSIVPHPKLIKDSTGKIIGAINILWDLTVLKNTEQKLRESESALLQLGRQSSSKSNMGEAKSPNLELEKAVEERTIELGRANRELALQSMEKAKRAAELVIANRELAYQNEEKEKRAAELVLANIELVFQNLEKEKRAAELLIANAELEAFSYISSHDLQEPLRKIQAFSSQILEIESKNLSEKGKDYFNRMQSAAVRMRILIDDLLAFSRLTISERKFENTDLNKIVEEVTDELNEIIEEKHGIVETRGLCKLSVIPFQFRQVMHNLISNAIKFSKPEYPPKIIIRAKIVKGNKLKENNLMAEKYCHISVSDNGIGFDQQYNDVIFKVFHRLHSKEDYAGTGIGLAIVKRVVENHSGFINATSKPGNGATFNIYIPVSH